MKDVHESGVPMNLYSRQELKESIVSSCLCLIMSVGVIRRYQMRLLERVIRLEGGVFYSYTLRKYLKKKRGIELGSYSYSSLRDLLAFPVKTVIGRYTSIGSGVKVFQANHPMGWPSMHPFFIERILVMLKKRDFHADP